MIPTMQPDIATLQAAADRVRRSVLKMAHAGRTPHVGSALSCVDLLIGLYHSALRIDPVAAQDPDRDRFVLSKGHGCMALYAVLAERGFFPPSLLDEYARDGSRLAEHPGRGAVPGIEAGSGSLGHGLPVGAGLALAAKIQGRDYRTFVLLSDAECQEGSVWEAAIFARANHLDNLVAIVDYNRLSAMGRTDRSLEPFSAKWSAFGWRALEIDGHDLPAITAALADDPLPAGSPTAIIAHTTKGKGVSFMEDDMEWHYRPPDDADLERALAELECSQPSEVGCL